MSRPGSPSTLVRRLRRLGPGVAWGLAALAVVVTGRVLEPRPFEFVQLRVFDFYEWLSPAVLPDRRTAIVDIDERSLETYGQWPWPRHLVAAIVERVLAAGPAALGFDFVFAEPDRVSPSRLSASLARLAPDIDARLAGLPDTDAILARAVGAGPVVLGQSAAEARTAATGTPGRRASIAERGAPAASFLPASAGVVRNIAPLEAAAAGIGAFTLQPEEDGIVRRIPTLVSAGGTIHPTLGIEMLRVATGETTLLVRAEPGSGIGSVVLGENEIPTDAQGRLWLRFARHDPGLYISAKDLLEGNIDPARLADRFIFLGTSAIGLHDVKATPLDRAIPGVEVHAIMLDSLFAGALLAQPDWAEGAELILTVAVGLFLVLLGPRLGSTGLGVAVVLACTAAWALSWTAYDGHGVLLDPALPTMAWIYAGTAVGFANYRREERQREAVRASFSRYVSPALVERLADDPTALRLGGELRELSILFCDIRGFTTMSERLDAKSLIALMNRYFTPMAGAVLDHRGMVDKYIGDAIMALWNAPLADPEHAANAARAALEMRRRLAQLNGELALEATGSGEAQIELRIGIGISTGPCAVGNIGTDQRLEYSALGDPVNLAARLESQSMRYGYDILLSEATQAGLSGFALIELDTIIVKGKSQPIRVYALVGDERTALLPAFIRLQSFHSELLQTYRDRQWAEAREIANECRRLAGEFGLRRVYKKFLQRIDVDEQRQVPENWGGIHIADRK